MKKLVLGFLLLAAAFPVLAADGSFALLIPLNYNGPGAYGATWHTVVEVNNRTSRDLVLLSNLLDPCPPGVYCGSPYLQAGLTGRLVNDAPHGMVLRKYFGTDGRFYGSVHIAAEPHDPVSEGTELPVAKDSDFDTTFIVLNVPTGAVKGHPTRALLRIYSLEVLDHGKAFVTVFAHDNPSVPLRIEAIELRKTTLKEEPMYAELDVSRYASLSSSVDVAIDATTATRIEQPNVTGGLEPQPFKVWGFVTVTDNATNEVTTITAR